MDHLLTKITAGEAVGNELDRALGVMRTAPISD